MKHSNHEDENVKNGYTKIERDPRYITHKEKYMHGFDGMLEEDTDEFGDKTIHGFLGRRRG